MITVTSQSALDLIAVFEAGSTIRVYGENVTITDYNIEVAYLNGVVVFNFNLSNGGKLCVRQPS